MVSGIEPTEEQREIFEKLKIDKIHRYFVLGLNKDRNGLDTIEIGARDSNLKDLVDKLPNDDCRFIIFDFEFKTKEKIERETSRLLLICWAPDAAPTKIKVPFISSKAALTGNFTGIQKNIQASDKGELDFEELRDQCCN